MYIHLNVRKIMSDGILLLLHKNTSNHLTVCKKIIYVYFFLFYYFFFLDFFRFHRFI